jgi:4-hydroxy-tetrahydrodipicolinate synthase
MYQHFRKIRGDGETADAALNAALAHCRRPCERHCCASRLPGIIGTGDATQHGRGADLARAPRNFAIYSGDDAAALPLIALGGHGVISVTANVAPRLMAEMCSAALVGDVRKAREINLRLLPLHQRLFIETSPAPVKWAMAQMGLIEPGLRLPMVPLSERA